MSLFDCFDLALRNLKRRKGRTMLTLVGVVIGAVCVVMMISIGQAAANATDAMLQSWGDLSLVTVLPRQGTDDRAVTLNDDSIQSFSVLDSVEAVSPQVGFTTIDGEIVAGRRGQYVAGVHSIQGLSLSTMGKFGYTLVSGTFPETVSATGNRIPILAAESAPFDFVDKTKSPDSPLYFRSPYNEQGVYDLEKPFFELENTALFLRLIYDYSDDNKPIYIEYEFQVVGILAVENGLGPSTSGFYMDSKDLQRLQEEYARLVRKNQTAPRDISHNQDGYGAVMVKVTDVASVAAVEAAIRDMGYDTASMTLIREEMLGQVQQSQIMLGSLAAVSLLVAALSITITMSTAILERRNEIGVMKVLGMRLSNLRTILLFESGFIGFLGGLIGCLISLILSAVINTMSIWADDTESFLSFFGFSDSLNSVSDKLSVVPLWLLLFTLLFSALIGVLAGLYPVHKALKLSSLEAMRQ